MLLTAALVTALLLGWGCQKRGSGEAYAFRTSGKAFEQWTDGGWRSVFVDGVNLGAGKPGCWPGEFGIGYDEYLRWFAEIADMNVSFLRVYVLQSPAFYEALYDHNRRSASPLYLIHGVYCDEAMIAAYSDAYCQDGAFEKKFCQDIETMVRVIHGDAVVEPSPGCASGEYTRDLSPYVAGYILGIEWDADLVNGTDALHPDRAEHRGTYVETSDGATPFEAFLARAAETAVRTDMAYGTQRPVALSNWITTDPLSHPAEPNPDMEDAATVDPEHIRATDAFGAGFFASYHVYPYYPDFLGYDAALAEAGGGDTYLGYLMALNAYHTMPVLVAEYGVPASRGLTHRNTINGMDQGHNNERDQAADIIAMNRAIRAAGMMGGLIFSWQDEWFKTAWNAMDIEESERRPYWYNVQSSEQTFGILAFDPGEQVSAATVDGDAAEWAGDVPVIESGGFAVCTRADAAYLYVLATWDPAAFGPEQADILLPLDVIAGQGNRSFSGARYDTGADFLIRIGADAGAVTVDPYYDVFHFQYAHQLSLVTTIDSQQSTDSGTFVPIYQALSRQLTLPETGETVPFDRHDTGALRRGTADPGAADYDSLADYALGDGVMELRLPWMLLNVTDPSSRLIVGDLYQNDAVVSVPAGDFRIGIYQDGYRGEVTTSRFSWDGWEQPAYHERLKVSYSILAEYFSGVAE